MKLSLATAPFGLQLNQTCPESDTRLIEERMTSRARNTCFLRRTSSMRQKKPFERTEKQFNYPALKPWVPKGPRNGHDPSTQDLRKGQCPRKRPDPQAKYRDEGRLEGVDKALHETRTKGHIPWHSMGGLKEANWSGSRGATQIRLKVSESRARKSAHHIRQAEAPGQKINSSPSSGAYVTTECRETIGVALEEQEGIWQETHGC